MSMKLKFQTSSSRVKGVAFHPSKPWVISSLHSGLIQIWDYNMKISISKFEDGHDGPVRGIDFHQQLPLFVSGGDDGIVKVWDYKQKRCMFSLKGHIDYIRTAFFHHELPWILSASDDQTMRIWNYQSRACVNIITGHSHYVMCAQFHHQKNFIVSASLDSTIRIWDFTVLKKKLTQTKNLSSFIGVEIECIKVLDGHDRGCNWVCFHPNQNLIASSSDDRKIKLWKYTNEVAWEHSTISGHKNNVSCIIFDEKSGNLISNSEDKCIKTWNYQTKNCLQTHKRQNQRYWIFRITKSGNLLAAGHDGGLQIFQINKQIVPYGLVQANLVVYAQGMKTLLYDTQKNIQKQQLYQYTPKDRNSLTFINKIIVNQFDSAAFIVQIDENGEKIFMIKKKENYLNFPHLIKQYEALDSCFISRNLVAVLKSPREIHIISSENKDSKRQVFKLTQQFSISRIFTSSRQNELIFATDDCIAIYDVKNGKIIGQQALEPGSDIRNVVVGKDKLAIFGKHVLIITNPYMESIATIHQKFSIRSAFWERPNLLFYTTKNHWKYALMNGENGVLKTLEQPFYLVRKIQERQFLAFNQTKNVFKIECPSYVEIQFKLAVNQKNWEVVNEIIKNKMGKEKKNLVSYLVSKGHPAAAIDLIDTNEEKFALAIQSTNFQLAFEMCNKINTPEYWKLLGDQALKQGIYEAYELSNQKQKQYDKLNFLYSLQGNVPKLEKMLKLSNKINNCILAFNSALFLNNGKEKQQILRDCGLDALAELAQQAETGEVGDRLKKLGYGKLNLIKPEQEIDLSNWPHNVVDDEEQEQEEEK